MRIGDELRNGETLDLIRQVKQQMKDMQTWEDDVSRNTTVLELIIGEKKLKDYETVAEVGLFEGSKASTVFRLNVAQCSDEWALDPDLDD